ncbi:hypothetical protein GOP47_0015467 [Adiantum capillus-veneris]|uniref:C2H2-type domain-containing protein n=1 Tax=Adiantum capillus-veneris TaxID=13818 RepID=A0A9D4UKN7_ADICA|nr:hypothetical protein GOP47_0015467 [Adiantum capillus-veneris]
MEGSHNDASSCSTAASEQSDRRKRPNSDGDEDPKFKPYECRFCPIKFTKSQALGGHMNRHRQEREREQVINAQQLLMKQQDFSPTLMMSGQSTQPSLPKLFHPHLQRSGSDKSLKDSIRMGGSPLISPVGRGFLQSNPFNQCLNSPWNHQLESGPSSLQATFNFNGMVPYQGRQQPYSTTSLNSSVLSFMAQQPLNQAQDHMMVSASSDKSRQLSMFPIDSNNPMLQRGEKYQTTQQNQSQAQEGNCILTNSPGKPNFLSATNRSFLHQRSNELTHQSELFLLQPEVCNNLNFIPFSSGEEGVRTSLPTTQPIEFSLGSENMLDSTSWLNKSNQALNTLLSSTSKDFQQELENVKTKIDESLINSGSTDPKPIRWDLELQAMPYPDDIKMGSKESKPTSIVEGASTSPFEDDFSNATSNLNAQPDFNKSSPS